MNIDANGVQITLTQDQLKQIQKELNNQKPLMERLFNWQDILDYNNIEEASVLPWNNPNTPEKISQNGFAKLQLIKKTFNEDWVADFDNSEQYKYYTWYEKKKDWAVTYVFDYYVCSCSVGFGLFSKSEKVENHINKYFLNEICEFLG
jgi:hypothetical protein